MPAEELLYGADHYERFWAACQALAMPVNMHINSGPGRRTFSPQQWSGLIRDGAAGHKWGCMKAVGNIVAAGVLDRSACITIPSPNVDAPHLGHSLPGFHRQGMEARFQYVREGAQMQQDPHVPPALENTWPSVGRQAFLPPQY